MNNKNEKLEALLEEFGKRFKVKQKDHFEIRDFIRDTFEVGKQSMKDECLKQYGLGQQEGIEVGRKLGKKEGVKASRLEAYTLGWEGGRKEDQEKVVEMINKIIHAQKPDPIDFEDFFDGWTKGLYAALSAIQEKD